MKCTVCKKDAVIKLPRHNLKLCEEHFKEHIIYQTQRVIKHFNMFKKDDVLLLAVSGGKDSLGLWLILKELGFNVKALHIIMPFGKYSEKSLEIVENFAKKLNEDPIYIEANNYLDIDFFKALKIYKKPVCSFCGKIKRYILSTYASRNSYNTIITGHNLDDETAFLLGNVLHWHTEYLKKQGPVLERNQFIPKKVKPLIRITDEEMSFFAKVSKIEYVAERCPYSKDAKSIFFKDILNEIDKYMPGTKSFFYFQYVENIKNNIFMKDTEEPKECKICHYQTYSDDICFLCKIKSKYRG
ncbi:tRNA(Ile)-lysidine synthase TilS/MesJ [Thermodesulfobium acidiphilum]|uniref:tRNA(Ile)-lysidine synthase TilS/MesJ n=1 Tax=Thermodesulfobium acidiphilum TaxID=1794699 RepID=A0A2R4W1G0_THEAF|nr:ATP-binding protein [Thermodesulfobium acidiphilum]AWB10540.1 tRNA(Ile)-lysidine synthase TilS/MesJ [Thermodesulfobium acidiphilum]